MNRLIQLVMKPRQTLVQRHTRRRHELDKTNYIPYYIPRQTPYHRSRKPRQQQWDDESTTYPVRMPKPTHFTGKRLIQEIEQEEIERIKYKRNFEGLKLSAGDVVEFTMLHSISEQKGNTHKGLVIGTKRPNSLMSSFRVLFKFCGVQCDLDIKMNSPMLQDLKLVERGYPAHQKVKMYWITQMGLTKEQLQKPILRNNKKRKMKQDTDDSLIHNKNYMTRVVKDPLLQDQTRLHSESESDE